MSNVRIVLVAGIILASVGLAGAEDWSSVPYIEHSTYQAVNPDGSSAYTGGFPIKLVGVVLNNTEDWLDPTPAYDPGYHPFQLGAQAEFYVQAVNLDGTAWDPFPDDPFDDFGGTACWMGQNYGNLPWYQDPQFSYTDAEWTAELGRLNLYGGDNVTDPIRAGDLVEIRARAGLHYRGKMNVNEQHSKDPAKDFEIVRLQAEFGLPDPTRLTLGQIKNADDSFIFDPTRRSGGERYQSSLVTIHHVRLEDTTDWGTDSDLTLLDTTGRSLSIHLGLNPSFDATSGGRCSRSDRPCDELVGVESRAQDVDAG